MNFSLLKKNMKNEIDNWPDVQILNNLKEIDLHRQHLEIFRTLVKY